MGKLPTYSFIGPQIIGWNHNDVHPPFGGVLAALGKQLGADDAASLHFDPPSSLIGGEDLLARIYDAIRSSSSATGSNHLNTTLLLTFDEHGGTYDHVPPPPAVPPDGTGAPGQMGFSFDRSGVRIPTLAISAWIPEQTVVNGEFRATSLRRLRRSRSRREMQRRPSRLSPCVARGSDRRRDPFLATTRSRSPDSRKRCVRRSRPPGCPRGQAESLSS
jgi:phospholipase C